MIAAALAARHSFNPYDGVYSFDERTWQGMAPFTDGASVIDQLKVFEVGRECCPDEAGYTDHARVSRCRNGAATSRERLSCGGDGW